MIRSARPRLADIDANIGVIIDLAKGRTKNHLLHDIALRYAILHALMIIAEAVRHLPEPMLARHSHIPWKDIIGIGVIIKHEYHRVDPDVVWSAVTDHLPVLRPIIRAMLADVDQSALPL